MVDRKRDPFALEWPDESEQGPSGADAQDGGSMFGDDFDVWGDPTAGSDPDGRRDTPRRSSPLVAAGREDDADDWTIGAGPEWITTEEIDSDQDPSIDDEGPSHGISASGESDGAESAVDHPEAVESDEPGQRKPLGLKIRLIVDSARPTV